MRHGWTCRGAGAVLGLTVLLASAILGGMLAAIVVGIILVPAMYFLPQNLREKVKGTGAATRKAEPEAPASVAGG